MQNPNLRQLTKKIAIDFNTLLGKGSTGDVYKGVSNEPFPHPVAIKVIPLQQINNQVTQYLLQCQLQALKAANQTQNQSIVKLQQIVVLDNNCYIATQLLQGGTLKDFINQQKKLQPSVCLNILLRLLQGYKILKENGIIHRDLKPQNILFLKTPTNNELIPKIIDFGYCIVEKVQKVPKMYYNVGSPRYMSPEAYTNNNYSQKSDIWAIGIIFYEMLTGTTFDKGKNILESFKMIKEKGIPIPSSLSQQCKNLLQHMLMIDPNRRHTCEQIIQEINNPDFQKRETQNVQGLPPSNQVNNAQNNYPFSLNNGLNSNKFSDQPNKINSNLINTGQKPNIRVSFNSRELRGTVGPLDKNLIYPNLNLENRFINSRASMLNSRPVSRANGYLTKSVGFVVSPTAKDNVRQNVFNTPNQFNLKIDRLSLMNNLKGHLSEGPLTDRQKKQLKQPLFRQKERFISENQLQNRNNHNAKYSLKQNSSQQNLHKVNANLQHNILNSQKERFDNVNIGRRQQKNLRAFQQTNLNNQNNSNKAPFLNQVIIPNNSVNTHFSKDIRASFRPPESWPWQVTNQMQHNQINHIKPNQLQRNTPQSFNSSHIHPFGNQVQMSVQNNLNNQIFQVQPPQIIVNQHPTYHSHQSHQAQQPQSQQPHQQNPLIQISTPHIHIQPQSIPGRKMQPQVTFGQSHHSGPNFQQMHIPSHFNNDISLNRKNVKIMAINPHGQIGSSLPPKPNGPQVHFLHKQILVRPRIIEQTLI